MSDTSAYGKKMDGMDADAALICILPDSTVLFYKSFKLMLYKKMILCGCFFYLIFRKVLSREICLNV